MIKYIIDNWRDYHYWFTLSPTVWSQAWLIGLLIGLGVLLVAGLGSGIVAAHLKEQGNHLTAQVWRRARGLIAWTVFISVLLVGFRYEQVTLLSGRWWWVLLAAWLVWRIIKLALFVFKKLLRDQAALEKKMAFEKYLP